MIDTTFFEGEYPGIFDYIKMDETGHSLRKGQILMKPDIDFEAEYRHGVVNQICEVEKETISGLLTEQ